LSSLLHPGVDVREADMAMLYTTRHLCQALCCLCCPFTCPAQKPSL